jgi:hypothetical protein
LGKDFVILSFYMELKPLGRNILPNPPATVWKLLGPSFILVGLGLGTGELILWPYLTSNYGMGIIWGAVLGISMQYFLNMEIERYALANGESIFVGFARLLRWLPIWFIFSTILAWSWPGFSAGAAEVLKPFGIGERVLDLGTYQLPLVTLVTIFMLFLVGIIITLGPVLYKTMETFQKTLIMVGVPLIILIGLFVIRATDLLELMQGMVGIGNGYTFFPDDKDFPFMSFLAAFAYSGAGGNLLLAQSYYIKDKGYGMGAHAGRITSLITGKAEHINVEGSTFDDTPEEIAKFKKWWRLANTEHLIVFWGLGLFTMLLLAVLARATVFGDPGNVIGLNFIFNQAEAISTSIHPIFGYILLIVTSLMLFSTQLSVVDASARIVSENIVLMKKETAEGNVMPKIYYSIVWIILFFGITVLLFGFNEPRLLIVLGAVLNAVCMFVFAGLLIPVNMRFLNKSVQPAMWRKVTIWIIFAFMGIFSALVLLDQLGIRIL